MTKNTAGYPTPKIEVSVMYTIDLDRQQICITKEQAEALYSQLGSLLNKTTTYPNNPASPFTIPNTGPYVGPYPWTPGVTSYSTTTIPCSDESGYHGVKCRSED